MLNQFTTFLNANRIKVNLFFVIFYMVGLVGIIAPQTQSLFINLIPGAILLSTFALIFYHNSSNSKLKILFVFITIALISFFVEVIGVRTHQIFGNYYYGNGLGFQLLNTPLLIGINWIFLVYTTSSMVQALRVSRTLKILIPSVMMLIYDLVLEQVAPLLDMWHWENSSVPLQNYLAWFVLSLVLHSIIQVFKISIHNKLAAFIFYCQFFFFLSLMIFLSTSLEIMSYFI